MTTKTYARTPTITNGYGTQETTPADLLSKGLAVPHVRALSGIRLKPCQSCHIQPGILSVRYPDYVFVVCYGCRP